MDFNELNIINDDGIFIKNNFFNKEIFEKLETSFNNKDFDEIHQPLQIKYENKYQAYPCYQKNAEMEISNFIGNYFSLNLKNTFKLKTILRKTYSNELLKSVYNKKYGIIHKDNCYLAGVVYFDKTFNGGTAFYNEQTDKLSDIEVGAYPNRMILYKGNRLHSSCHDFSFKVRKILCFFIYNE